MCVCVCVCECFATTKTLVDLLTLYRAMNRATMMKVGEEVWVTFSQAVKADEGTYTCTATVNHNAAYIGFTEPSQQAMLNVDDSECWLACNKCTSNSS